MFCWYALDLNKIVELPEFVGVTVIVKALVSVLFASNKEEILFTKPDEDVTGETVRLMLLTFIVIVALPVI